jgi:hypothetical protein
MMGSDYASHYNLKCGNSPKMGRGAQVSQPKKKKKKKDLSLLHFLTDSLIQNLITILNFLSSLLLSYLL